jgi:hypothetical protein
MKVYPGWMDRVSYVGSRIRTRESQPPRGLAASRRVECNRGRCVLLGSTVRDGESARLEWCTDFSVFIGAIAATVKFIPFLLAVLLVVERPSRRTVAFGGVLIYGVELTLTVSQTIMSGFPGRIGLSVLAVPLPRVVVFLSIALAVWLAYHDGYERLVSILGGATQHPLFAMVADNRIGPALTLRRGLVTAGLAAIVGAGGLVLVGGLSDLLGAIARAGGSAPAVIPREYFWAVGIPVDRLPNRWAFEASFLLGILFVTGPRLLPRDLIKGLAVVLGVQSAVKLLPALLPPVQPVYLFGPSSPGLAALQDATVLVGIAAAVWLAFHGGLETLHSHTGLWPLPG